MTSPSEIAKRHFRAALEEAKVGGIDDDVIARHCLALVVTTFLKGRSSDDVRRELIAASENVDPDTDNAFIRP